MDKSDYSEQAVRKINIYSQNNICLGINLLTTFETQAQQLNIQGLETIIQHFLI